MELKLRCSFVLLSGVLLAASGCTVDMIQQDAGQDTDAQIPSFDGGTDAGPAACEPGEIDCRGTCTRVAEDSQNCGSCGNVCPSGFSCAIGRCNCAEPMKSCQGLCVDPSSDTMNCGACGNACATGETCLDGACVLDCAATEMRCTNEGEGGKRIYVCADLNTDPMNCGACNTVCAGGAICQDGLCGCPEGQINCSGMCTDISTDANNCGACLSSCGATGVCAGGTCTTCGDGLTACGSPRRCIDTMTSRLHCGTCDNTCGPGAGCTAGTCACLPGFTDCDGLCANLNGDVHNCGGCGIDCGIGGTCTEGVCTCAEGATMCGAECAVLSSNSEHCGSCDVACETGDTCVFGACLPLNNTCTTGWPVTADVTFTDQETAVGGSRAMGDSCGGGSGNKALYYAVTIPPGQLVRMTTDSSDDLVVFEQAACGDTECVQQSDSPEALTLSNPGTSEVTRVVGVRMWSDFSDGTFDISFAYAMLAPNGSCSAATPITADTTLTGEDAGLGGPRPDGTNCGFGSGSTALYYAVTIPPSQRVEVQTDPVGDIVLFDQVACGDTDCVDSTDSFPESTTLANASLEPITRIVGVRAYSATGNGTYDIDFTYSTVTFAANASCETATVVTADTTLTGQDATMGGPRPHGEECGFGTSNAALYYAVTIPAGQVVDIQTTPSSGSDIVLFEQVACGDTDCVDYTDSSPESLRLSNATPSTMTRIVGVRPYATTSGGTIDISFTYSSGMFAPNASCEGATVITADTTITGEDTETGGPRPTGDECGNGSGEKALYYAVTVPAGGAVLVQSTPGSETDLVLFDLTACGNTDCIEWVDTTDPESLTLTNITASDVTRIVGVRGYNHPGGSFHGGPYDIQFTYATP